MGPSSTFQQDVVSQIKVWWFQIPRCLTSTSSAKPFLGRQMPADSQPHVFKMLYSKLRFLLLSTTASSCIAGHGYSQHKVRRLTDPTYVAYTRYAGGLSRNGPPTLAACRCLGSFLPAAGSFPLPRPILKQHLHTDQCAVCRYILEKSNLILSRCSIYTVGRDWKLH